MTTGVFAVVLIVVALAAAGWGSAVAAGTLVAAAAFATRSYSVMDGKLVIHRLGWSTKFDLTKRKSAEVNPGVRTRCRDRPSLAARLPDSDCRARPLGAVVR